MRISYSRFSAYQTCPQRYRLQYVDRVPVPTPPEMHFGAAVHEALKALHEPGRLQPPSLEELVETFVRAWQAREAEVPEDQRQAYFESGVDMLRRHHAAHGQPEEGRYTAATEQFFAVPFEGNHTLVGVIDRVDVVGGRRLEIIDYKTGRRMPAPRDMEKNAQLAIYRLAGEHLYPGREVSTKLWYLFHDYQMELEQSVQFLADMREEIREAILGIEVEDFEPTPGGHCDWCAYRAHCPLFRAPRVPEDLSALDIGALLKEYVELAGAESRAKARREELRGVIGEYLDRCQTETVEGGGYVAARRKSLRVTGWDQRRLREVLDPLGLWERVTQVSSAAVRELLGWPELSREQRRAIESAADRVETTTIRVRRVGGADDLQEPEE